MPPVGFELTIYIYENVCFIKKFDVYIQEDISLQDCFIVYVSSNGTSKQSTFNK